MTSKYPHPDLKDKGQKAKGKRQRAKPNRQETYAKRQEARGKRQRQKARGKVDPQGWLRAPYSPGPNSQANDFITKRVEMLKSFAGAAGQKRPRPEAGTPGGGEPGGGPGGGEEGGGGGGGTEEKAEPSHGVRKKLWIPFGFARELVYIWCTLTGD